MAYGDFADMQARATRLGRRDPTDSTDLARAADALNDALLSVMDDGSLFDFLETEGTFATVAGTDTYSYTIIGSTTLVPTNGTPGEILSITDDSNAHVLRSLSWEVLERAVLDTQYSGQPQGQPEYFAKWGAGAGAKVRLYPEPDAVYTLRWFGRQGVGVMSAGTDVPPIPLSYRHRILTPLAAAQLLRMESGFSADYEASSHEAQAQQAIQQMRASRGAAKKPAMGVVAPGWDRHLPPVDATGW